MIRCDGVKTCKHTGVVHTESSSYSGSSAEVTAPPPDLMPSRLMDGQEEGMAQSRGKRDAFRGLVLQHLLQQIEKLMVLCAL